MGAISRFVDILVGKRLSNDEEPQTPLLSSMPRGVDPDRYLEDRKRIVKARVKQLVSCNLEVFENYFNLSMAIVMSRNSWKDATLMHDTPDHRAMLPEERAHFQRDEGPIWKKLWNQPWAMKWLILVCGLGAMVQGLDEAAINSAQVYYAKPYGLDLHDARIGYINGAPYACCFISCWLSWPLNRAFGRRGTIFLAALCSAAFALGQAFAEHWQTMLVLRVLLGLGIGPKSATIPMYASEVSPAELRGALVMWWQLFTALGIMLGYLSGVAFAKVLDGNEALSGGPACSNNLLSIRCSLNWRLMVASSMIAPAILCFFIFWLPESPRLLITRAQQKERFNRRVREHNRTVNFLNQLPVQSIDLLSVFQDLVQLRGGCKLKAARDMLIMDVLLWEQKQSNISNDRLRAEARRVGDARRSPRNQGTGDAFPGWITERSRVDHLVRIMKRAGDELKLLILDRRNSNALTASLIVLVLQQYCGINVLIYYSTAILFEATTGKNLTTTNDIPIFIVQSFVVGLTNFLFGLPSLVLIDQRGRRSLLLRTFPFLAISMALVAGGTALAARNNALPAGNTTLAPGDPPETLQYSSGGDPLILGGMYLFVIFYSLGEGPVPFVYASESFPQNIRDLGMAVVTSLNWALNFAVAVSFPRMSDNGQMHLYGTFSFYTLMCFIGFWLIYFFVPETCELELEQLDKVFEKSLMEFAKENLLKLWTCKRPQKTNIEDYEDFSETRSSPRSLHQTSSADGIDIEANNHRSGSGSHHSVEMEPYPRRPRLRDTSPVGSV